MERPERQRREKRSRCSQWEAGSSGEGLGPRPPYLGRQGEEHGQQSQRHQQQHQQAPCAPYLLGQRRQRRHPRNRRSAARLPLSGGQGPKTPRGGEEPRGTAPAAPPGRQRVGGGVGGDKEQGRGPRAPTPQTHTTLGALDSGGKWGENQVGLKASALSPQFRPFGTDHAAVTHKWPRVTGLAASSRLGGWWGVEMR